MLPEGYSELNEINRLRTENHNLGMRMGTMGVNLAKAREANRAMANILAYLLTAIMPDVRKYNDHKQCLVHRDTLAHWENKIKEGLKEAQR